MVSREIDTAQAIQIAPRIWWVGSLLPADRFQCHVYLVEQGTHSVLIDPGSALLADEVIRKVDSVVGLENVRWLVCSQPDADIVAALPKLVARGLHGDAAIVTHWRSEASIVHTGTPLPFWRVEDHHWRLELEDRTLQFIFTPYLHFAGAFCTFDAESGTLFSSALFGSFTETTSLYVASTGDFSAIRSFHEHYMPNREILGHALQQLRDLPLQQIAPQHGRIVPHAFVPQTLELLEALECGIFLLARDDPGLAFLLAANQTIRDVVNTMVREQDFAVVAAYLAELATRSLGAEYFELWAGTTTTFYQFDRSDSFAGHGAEPPSDVASVLAGATAESGLRLILPLRSPVSSQIDGAMLWGFRERRVLSDATTTVLSQIISLVEVGLERELLRRSADLERAAWHTQAIHDSLTGLYNRVSLDDSFVRLASFDDRNPAPRIAALMIDIDLFKQVNDTFGHSAGDQVIQRVAESITQSVRPSDLVFRFGGEEFLILISNVDATTAITAAERIRVRVASWGVEVPTVTVSVGVALRHVGEAHETLIARADKALYLAKVNGRNRIELAL